MLVDDGSFGQNRSVLTTAVEMGFRIWVIMNNFGCDTVTGLQMSPGRAVSHVAVP